MNEWFMVTRTSYLRRTGTAYYFRLHDDDDDSDGIVITLLGYLTGYLNTVCWFVQWFSGLHNEASNFKRIS